MSIDKRFIMSISGKEFIKFEGLLAEFHENNGQSIETIELENSTPEHPRFKAIVVGEKGSFTGHGDANDTNVNSMVKAHKYRMAETRAIARALRWYNNIGMCSLDELGGDNAENIELPPRPSRIELFKRIKEEVGSQEPSEEQIKEAILTRAGVKIEDIKELKDFKKLDNILEMWK